jgi:hypothetical protein
MHSLHKLLGRVDFNKLLIRHSPLPGSLVGLAAGMALGYFACVCVKQSAQNEDEAEMRRRRVGCDPSPDTQIPDSINHTRGWHTNSRGMVMCNQQFVPKDREVLGVVGICHGFSDHTHGLLMDFAVKLCEDGFVVITMDVEVSASNSGNS